MSQKYIKRKDGRLFVRITQCNYSRETLSQYQCSHPYFHYYTIRTTCLNQPTHDLKEYEVKTCLKKNKSIFLSGSSMKIGSHLKCFEKKMKGTLIKWFVRSSCTPDSYPEIRLKHFNNWDLRVSNASWWHHREAKNHFPERFHSPFPAGGMIFPSPSGTLDPCQTWKLTSSVITWLHLKKKTCALSLTSPCLAIVCSEPHLCNFVLQALPVSVWLVIMHHLLYSSSVSHFGLKRLLNE